MVCAFLLRPILRGSGEFVKLCLFVMGMVVSLGGLAQNRVEYKIVTASERGTYIQIGRDLAKWVADPASITLSVLPSNGSADNVARLRYEAGVKLALVQSDVYQAMLDAAQAGNRSAATLIRPLRVIMPLYDEEIYFVTRADSPLKFIHELQGKRINVGLVGSGTALSATTLYRLMFGQALPEANTTYYSNEEALLKLTTDKSIDVAVIVAGQPAKLFTEMKPDARQYIKFLQLDQQAKEMARVSGTYFPATIRRSSYPTWLTTDVPTLTVKAFLVTYNYDTPATQYYLTRFSRALCLNFDNLRTYGHPKWQQMQFALPTLGAGWSYYGPTEKILRTCTVQNQPVKLPTPPVMSKPCNQQDKLLGLCAA